MLDSFLWIHYSTATFVEGFPLYGVVLKRRYFTNEETITNLSRNEQLRDYNVHRNCRKTITSTEAPSESRKGESRGTITESLILAQDECWRRV